MANLSVVFLFALGCQAALVKTAIMGKTKPRHKSNRKHNKSDITGIPSVNEPEAELQPTSDDSTILNIIEEIQSSNVEERLCGLQSLLTLTEKVESVEAIIKYKVLKIVAPMLIDKSSEVRNFTAGVLRNLSASGSPEICERLVKDDIMTPVVALLQQYNDWNPESSKAEDSDTLLQVVNILWNLCEMDETALKYFNSANLLNILLRCLDYKSVGLDLSIAVCQCLNTVSEDNTAVTSALHNHESVLYSVLEVPAISHKLLLFKTLAASIVVNLNNPLVRLVLVLSVVDEALREDVRGKVSQLSSQLPLDSATQLTADVQQQLDSITALVEAQTLALELLANLTNSQDDDMDVEAEESASDNEDELNGWSDADDMQPLILGTEIHEGLEKFKLVSTVFSKVHSLPQNVMDIMVSCTYSRSLAKKTVRLQCRAFLCFNNLVSVVDIEHLGGPHYLYSLVKQISCQKLCVNPQQPGIDFNLEIVEASTAAIRAILLRLASIKFTDLGEIHPNDLEDIFKIGLTPEPRVMANVIRIVGTLGVLLVSNNLLLVKSGNYLLELAEKQLALWLTAEALDCLMDVFGDDCTDQAAAQINLVPRLQALTQRFRSKMRQERRTLGEHYPVVSTVMTNLSPFIKYKGARVNALNNP